MKQMRIVCIFLIAALLCGLLCACSGGETQNSAAKSHFEGLISGSYTKVSIGNKGSWVAKDNYSFDDENKIEAYAFDYLINGNTASGDIAVARLIEYLGKVQYASSTDL